MIEFGPSKKPMWNDGPTLEDFMGVEGAPPIATKHLCYGGGGGGTPQAPDYSQYIKAMSDIGNTMTGYGKDLYGWATEKGKALGDLADTVSKRAGGVADDLTAQGREILGNWKKLYTPLFESQVADAKRLNENLPQTEEQYAGKYEADAAMAIDAAKASSKRALRAQGISPSVGQAAMDQSAAVQRGAALSAAGETGRQTADTVARNVTTNAINTSGLMANVGNTDTNTGMQAGQLQFQTPAAAITTTAGAYSPSLGYYQGAFPYLGQWGSTMSNSYNQQLAAYKAQQESGGGMGALAGAALGAIGTIGGAYLGGPAGAAVGGQVAGSVGKGIASNAATGGMIPEMARGGAPAGPHYVHPSASPSRGAITDDVPARLNAGEFVFPKDVVSWRGEAWMQKEIQKARQERQQKEVAKPTMSPAGAIHATPPRFRSEGARA